MKLIGEVLSAGLLKIISPATLGGRDTFKIEDYGNLQHFPAGTKVEFKLINDGQSQLKLASIICKADDVKAPAQELAPVIELSEVREKKISKINSLNKPLHFYTVFNPMFNENDVEDLQGPTQAHSFYNLLKKKVSDGKDQFLYWGKLKSTDANEILIQEHYEEVVSKNNKQNRPTHLYISDFNHFWCARVESVEFKLDKSTASDQTINFYKNNWDRIEVWFKITDMILLSNNSKDTNEYISYLIIETDNKLNTKQDPTKCLRVTPYLSGLRYPLIIEDAKKEAYFGFTETSKAITLDNVLLENNVSKTQEVKTTINSYVIPEKIFSRFSHQVQNEVLSAEIEYFTNKRSTVEESYRTDFSVARKYLIALEKSLNDVINDTNPPIRSALYPNGSNKSLKDIYYDIQNQQHAYLKEKNIHLYNFLTNYKRAFLKLNEIRNNKIHLNSKQLDHNSIVNVRRVILGVGTEGLLVLLFKAAYEDLDTLFDINTPVEIETKAS